MILNKTTPLLIIGMLLAFGVKAGNVQFQDVEFEISTISPPAEVTTELAEIYKLLTYYNDTDELIISKLNLTQEESNNILNQKMKAYESYKNLPPQYKSNNVEKSFNLLVKFLNNKAEIDKIKKNTRFRKEKEDNLFYKSLIVTYFNNRTLKAKGFVDRYFSRYSMSNLFGYVQTIDPSVLLYLVPSDFGSQPSSTKDSSHLAYTDNNFTLLNVLIDYAPAFEEIPEHILALLGDNRSLLESYKEIIESQRENIKEIDETRKSYVEDMRKLFAKGKFTEYLILHRFYESLFPASVSILSHNFNSNELMLDNLVHYEGIINSIINYDQADISPEKMEELRTHIYHNK